MTTPEHRSDTVRLDRDENVPLETVGPGHDDLILEPART